MAKPQQRLRDRAIDHLCQKHDAAMSLLPMALTELADYPGNMPRLQLIAGA